MFTFLYWLCVMVVVAYFVIQWPKSVNKIKCIAGFIAAFLPLVNFVLAGFVAYEFYKQNKS